MALNSSIIVIGAGIAGLAAAKVLSTSGTSVIILEARDIIGGRIQTDNSLGIPLSLGPQWIHGHDGNPLVALADRANAKYVETQFNGNVSARLVAYDKDNQPLPTDYTDNIFHYIEATAKACKHYAMQQPTDISFATALNKILTEIDSPFADAIYQQALIYARLYFNSNPHLMSARYGDEEERFPGADNFMLDGFMPICDMLAKNLTIHFNTEVTAISYHDHGAVITTKNGIYSADAVIITVPLGVLKNNNIQFDPPLPNDHQQAINHLAMGVHDTLALKFPTIFWPQDCRLLCFLQEQADFPLMLNFHLHYQAPILACKIGGELAQVLEMQTDAIWLAKAMEQLRSVFGKNVPEPTNYVISRWGRDPYTLGSYSYIPVGASSKDYQQLSIPINNKIFFAGEATQSAYPATVHGAYLSGLQAAKLLSVCI